MNKFCVFNFEKLSDKFNTVVMQPIEWNQLFKSPWATNLEVGTLKTNLEVGTFKTNLEVGTFKPNLEVGTFKTNLEVGTLKTNLEVGTFENKSRGRNL